MESGNATNRLRGLPLFGKLTGTMRWGFAWAIVAALGSSAACDDDDSVFSSSSSGGASFGDGAKAISDGQPVADPPTVFRKDASTEPGEMPVVACVSESDAGADAGDAGGDASGTCATAPPSKCQDALHRVDYGPGDCISRRCVFSQRVVECPGGCFRTREDKLQCNR